MFLTWAITLVKKGFANKAIQDTTIDKLQFAFRQARNIPPDKHFYLMFDGERLKPFDMVANAEIEDMDSIEVHFKE
jgi:hypothetical protein